MKCVKDEDTYLAPEKNSW